MAGPPALPLALPFPRRRRTLRPPHLRSSLRRWLYLRRRPIHLPRRPRRRAGPTLDEYLEEFDEDNDGVASASRTSISSSLLPGSSRSEQLSLYNVHTVDSAFTKLMLRCRTLDQIKMPHYVAPRLLSIVIANCDVTNIAIWPPNVNKFHFSGRYVMEEYSLGEGYAKSRSSLSAVSRFSV